MSEHKSPTAVLREGPRALSDAQVREIEDSSLEEVLHVDIDDVIEYVHKDLRSLPDFTTLYRKYLKQRWDVYDLDFTQDKIDWEEKMTEEERQSFIAVASGFHHGERQVEIELPVFMIGASEEEKLHIAAQIEDEARHTVFFDRFYREVVGLKDAVRKDSTMISEIHDTLRTILSVSGVVSRRIYYEPLGWTDDEVRAPSQQGTPTGSMAHWSG